MIMYRFNIDTWSCRHCDGKGVCFSGEDKYSCKSCIRLLNDKENSIYVKVKCSICNGTGLSTPTLKAAKLSQINKIPKQEIETNHKEYKWNGLTEEEVMIVEGGV
jgi:hypothetical protein